MTASRLLLASSILLAGCGASGDNFAPACPGAAIVRDAADLARFRGAGRDITDAVLTARVTGLGGACKQDGAGFVSTTVQVGMEVVRGPANTGRTAELSYFVAVVDGERILDKQVYGLRAEFPSNTDRLRLTGDEVELRLPVSATKSASAYRIQVGFQLTPLELEVNRRQAAR